MDMNRNLKLMKKYLERDAVLKRIGLEERTPAGDLFTGLGLFAVGVLVGAGDSGELRLPPFRDAREARRDPGRPEEEAIAHAV